ncbi:MAG TPA: choice-of-anchor Q domain-containing protein [Ferruginibacter sp.]|nr:choice-of-anchor Q domain-containing protein [Ferruginibacter sp.]
MKKFNLLVLLCFLFFNGTNATIRYVTPSGGTVIADGTSWANAFPGGSLQLAISSSIAGDQVWVMTGTYYTTITTDRNIYFSMQNGVAIYGSFNGTETALSQRIFSCGFSSVLSGEIGVAGNADNSYHVINNSSLNNTAILDGFTITGGHANFDLVGNDNRSLGAGMLNNAANTGICSPTIRNCLFTNNTALFGGGIFDHGQNAGNANPVITNCIFIQNTATGGGGAIDNFGYNGNASPVITNSIFYMNTATDRAGAMYCWGGGNGNASPTILNCLFINNSSFDGGGIVADRSNFVSGNSGTANPSIRNSIFWGNTAGGTGPQFFLIGAAGFAATYSAIDVTNQSGVHSITGPGTGNIVTAPAFLNIANAIGPDNCWLTSDDGLQLQLGSAGIDAGNNTGVPAFDIRNFNRITNAVVDMNAYEFSSVLLPLNLKSFSGIAGKKINMLYWSVAAESKDNIFELQRSIDAVQFETIGHVTGPGNSGNAREYEFADTKSFEQSYYYRLKQVQQDGKYLWSNIILLAARENKQHALVFPNPVEGMAKVYFREALLNEEFLLFSSNGQLVDRMIMNGRTGHINLTGKAPGLYSLVNKKLGITLKIHKLRTGL